MEEIVPDLFEFAFHARRVNQICELHDFNSSSIKLLQVVVGEGDPGDWETKYEYALNRLVHVESFTFGSVHADHRKVFENSRANLLPLYLRVSTDCFEVASISIFGLVFCFLTEIIPEIRRRHPHLRF